MLNPASERMPAWYELSYKNESTLILRVHDDAMEHGSKYTSEENWLVGRYKEKYSISNYVPLGREDCGFGHQLKWIERDDDGWNMWEMHFDSYIPPQEGERWGKWPTTDIPLRCTLSLFLANALWLYNKGEGGSKTREQLLVFENIGVGKGGGDAGFSVTLTPTVIRFLRQFPAGEQEMPEVMEAMRWTYEHIYKREKFARYEAFCRDGYLLFLMIPGDRSTLSPYNTTFRKEKGHGYSIDPHNVDSSRQQFGLLAGLAKLHDLVRAWEKSQ